MVYVLLANGAQPKIKDNQGKDAAMLAIDCDCDFSKDTMDCLKLDLNNRNRPKDYIRGQVSFRR